MGFNDEYDKRVKMYDSVLTDLLPKLTVETVGDAVKLVNALVVMSRPRDWATCSRPEVIFGMTSDGQRVVYRDEGRLGFYHAEHLGDVLSSVRGEVQKARRAVEENKKLSSLGSDANAAIQETRRENLAHQSKLLEQLLSYLPFPVESFLHRD